MKLIVDETDSANNVTGTDAKDADPVMNEPPAIEDTSGKLSPPCQTITLTEVEEPQEPNRMKRILKKVFRKTYSKKTPIIIVMNNYGSVIIEGSKIKMDNKISNLKL
jgi:hypothetical protein